MRVARRIGEVYRDVTLALAAADVGRLRDDAGVRDLPFVARRSRRDPDEVRDALGIPARSPVSCSTSFGGYGLDGLDEARSRAMDGYHVLLPGMIDENAMYERGYRYEDLVRAVDVVVTKPGYGIISSASRTTPRCCTRRAAIFASTRCWSTRCRRSCAARSSITTTCSRAAGRAHLDALLAQPAPPTSPPTDGADVAADILLDDPRMSAPAAIAGAGLGTGRPFPSPEGTFLADGDRVRIAYFRKPG